MHPFQTRRQIMITDRLRVNKDLVIQQIDLEITENQPLFAIRFSGYGNLVRRGPCYNRRRDLPRLRVTVSGSMFVNWCWKHGLQV